MLVLTSVTNPFNFGIYLLKSRTEKWSGGQKYIYASRRGQ